MIMDDKMVELIRFSFLSEAEILVNLLKSEGVDCYARDSFFNQIYGGVDLGGVKIELLYNDLQRAKEIMRAYGYEETEKDGELTFTGRIIEGFEVPGIGKMRESEDIVEAEELDEAAALEEEDRQIFAEYEKKRAKLSRTMLIYSIVIIILVGILILLNKYYNL